MNAPPRRQRPMPLVTFSPSMPLGARSRRAGSKPIASPASYSAPFPASPYSSASFSKLSLTSTISPAKPPSNSPIPPPFSSSTSSITTTTATTASFSSSNLNATTAPAKKKSATTIPKHLTLPAPGVSLRTKFAVVSPKDMDPGDSKYLQPVPPRQQEDIVRPKRGRNARKRMHQAEHFRQYLYLRRQLKPWSDNFRRQHGRTPSLVDVHQASVPGLLDRFVEYLEALDRLRD